MTAGRWVLVVEDNDDDIVLTRRALGKIEPGLQIRWARDGTEAIEVLGHCEGPLPSYVLLDWKLPLRNGAEVLAWIRGVLPRELPVVVLTSSPLVEDREEAARQGADGLLQKPLRPAELVDLLGDRMGRG